jgi:uncharacterized phage protein (TIGR02220 family)
MNLLINEPPLQVLPSLATKIGLNEAIFLQQLHFRLLISTNERDGHKWIYKTYDEWQSEFKFWSYDTVKRTIGKLEKIGFIITTSAYNKMKMDKTKWYRVNYSKLGHYTTEQIALSKSAICTDGAVHNALTDEGIMHSAIPKDFKNTKKSNVEQELNVALEIINYLNENAKKSFKTNSSATKKLIGGRIREGYSLDDFKRVIDVKVLQWLSNPNMNAYLRPSTLFNATNFENYLNEKEKGSLQ